MMIRMMSHSVLLLLQELQNMTGPFSALRKWIRPRPARRPVGV